MPSPWSCGGKSSPLNEWVTCALLFMEGHPTNAPSLHPGYFHAPMLPILAELRGRHWLLAVHLHCSSMERDCTILHFIYLFEILTLDAKWVFFRHVQLLSLWHTSQRLQKCPELQGLAHWFLLEVLLYLPEKGHMGTEKHHLNAIYWSGQICWGSHDKRVVGCCQLDSVSQVSEGSSDTLSAWGILGRSSRYLEWTLQC